MKLKEQNRRMKDMDEEMNSDEKRKEERSEGSKKNEEKKRNKDEEDWNEEMMMTMTTMMMEEVNDEAEGMEELTVVEGEEKDKDGQKEKEMFYSSSAAEGREWEKFKDQSAALEKQNVPFDRKRTKHAFLENALYVFSKQRI
ncbi:uncharacterized protein MONOS_15649 [Monocercomonoides exilis]|uniref:uncharacterized protein n=1 Tax=Monocercomonoides exilis TaxID=2049356 RepID=UPI003559FBFA|nr:hypothetical protein MONOS_15649 [Monocercomonoides exilis]|eukprot:MONOS_15649.1-p1 / transcript=MONOS_15649.1 / gene=MONOS_15649 / organism=Monocercomonoides_exilis_PA203 / gene_product=unspecified product / transcript_product=unspecified product / location=Mono_scaffold01297:4935-5360(-) / protein_length=142 / sequence_SO=supercontig / SO=protein_coding / is_pseudo=false